MTFHSCNEIEPESTTIKKHLMELPSLCEEPACPSLGPYGSPRGMSGPEMALEWNDFFVGLLLRCTIDQQPYDSYTD